ncbi:uncharacterized protein PSFLO_06911 [Pseudozyma flocculosa]|uniref:Uncharacterized protein n=2 Tax=Pseudozyma flocculosa TaxID=84751 RepID=A0A5C3FDI8_9BASI|nr:uncharacterized protein PSFLO_06911 [Pseudozyma flocculosa]
MPSTGPQAIQEPSPSATTRAPPSGIVAKRPKIKSSLSLSHLAIVVPPAGALGGLAEPKTTFTFPKTPTQAITPADGISVVGPNGRRRSFVFVQPETTTIAELSQSRQPVQMPSQPQHKPQRRIPALRRISEMESRNSSNGAGDKGKQVESVHSRQGSHNGSVRSFTPIGSFDAPVVAEGSDTVQPGNIVYASFVMARHIYTIAQTERWFRQAAYPNAVAVRVNVGNFVIYPQDNFVLGSFADAVLGLNCDAAIIVSTPLVTAALSTLEADSSEIRLAPGRRIQVVDGIDDLRSARRAQMAAFLAPEEVLVLWTESCGDLIDQVRAFEALLAQYVWQVSTTDPAVSAPANAAAAAAAAPPTTVKPRPPPLRDGAALGQAPSGHVGHGRTHSGASSIRSGHSSRPYVEPSKGMSSAAVSDMLKEHGNLTDTDVEHLESYTAAAERVQWLAGGVRGLATCVSLLLVAVWLVELVSAVRQDARPVYLVALLAVPALFLAVLPLADTVASATAMAFGPILPMRTNSRYYSGRAAQPPAGNISLPHITIQVPVGCESMHRVIRPTLDSLRAAVTEYELRGGTASILIAEDGLALVDEEERAHRLNVYRRHDLAWIARPSSCGPSNGRNGTRKAASLNFAMRIGTAYEQGLASDPNQDADDVLQRVLAQVHPEAQGEGNVRLGDLILVVDSNSRIPPGSLLPSAWEMLASPDVAILQHCPAPLLSGAPGFFERSVAYLERCNKFITSWQSAVGEVAPFLGHSAFIRRSALDELVDADSGSGGQPWSQDATAEDLNLALRLLLRGWITRWATHADDGFLRGVSLSYHDEVDRWKQRYVGMVQLFVHPLYRWPLRGPVPSLTLKVMASSRIPLHYKLHLLSECAGLGLLALSLPFAFALYLVEGWMRPWLLPFFVLSFEMWCLALVSIVGAGSLGLMVARHRSGDTHIFSAMFQHVLWTPLNLVLAASLSLHLAASLLAHLFSIPIRFGVPAKDTTATNFLVEARLVVRRCWPTILVSMLLVGCIAVLATDAVPFGWQVAEWRTIVPTASLAVSALVAPVVLNPSLVRFSF